MSILAIVHEIEKIRILRGISIKALAEQAGIGIWTYYHWSKAKAARTSAFSRLSWMFCRSKSSFCPEGLRSERGLR